MPLPQELAHDRITGSEEMQADIREERKTLSVEDRLDRLESGVKALRNDILTLYYHDE